METQDIARSEQPPVCVECLYPAVNAVFDIDGEPLCAGCAETYYTACAGCDGLVAQDQAVMCDSVAWCGGCLAKSVGSGMAEMPGDNEVESLVAEYLALHAECDRLEERLGEIKERLKMVAAARPRVAGAVTLRGGGGAVRCSYAVKFKCNAEKVAALEAALDQERFTSLFKKKVSFDAIKNNLEEFLSGDGGESAGLREAVRDAVEKTETPTLSVIRQKKIVI